MPRRESETVVCPVCDAQPGRPCDPSAGPRNKDLGVHVERWRIKHEADMDEAYQPRHMGPAGRYDNDWLDAEVYISFTLACGCSSPMDVYRFEPVRQIESIGAGQMRHCQKHGPQRIVRLTEYLANTGPFKNTPRTKGPFA